MMAILLDELELPLLDLAEPSVAANPFGAARAMAIDT